MGVSYTRKHGLDEAKGSWIAILDSDDLWLPEKLAKQVEFQKKTNADLLYTGSGFMNVDALITNEKGVTLVTHYADCTPLFFVDKEKKAIGLAHAGWRGTVGRIGEEEGEAPLRTLRGLLYP